ncbi:hypothetical protein AMECASPLE_009400 [Ameca splendens]|uniref:Uncharacterized protein n=1 Tax=Ameca splendens TaxID=208324 RepID=A0ABV0YZL8_9TELE
MIYTVRLLQSLTPSTRRINHKGSLGKVAVHNCVFKAYLRKVKWKEKVCLMIAKQSPFKSLVTFKNHGLQLVSELQEPSHKQHLKCFTCAVAQSFFQIKQNLAFHLEIKVQESKRVYRHRIQVT